MAYEIGGYVLFNFTGVIIDDLDPYEAEHIVENMSVGELLEYTNGDVQVAVASRKVV